MLAAGTPPDFVRVVGAPNMPNLMSRGIAADLTSYFDKSKVVNSSQLVATNNVYRWDGKSQGQGPRYGMIHDWSQDSMFWYNKKLFDRAGVAYPSATEPMNYDELLTIAKKLTVRQGGKIQIYGLDAEWGFVTQGQIMQMLAQEGKSLFNSDYTQADFTTPEARKILQWYVDWAQAHAGPSPLDPDPGGWSWPPFQANRLAMAMYGYWFGGVIDTDTQGLTDHVGFAPAPVWGSQRISCCRTATGAWIPQASKKKDAAFKLMEFFEGGPPAQTYTKQGHGIPALQSMISLLPQQFPYQQQSYQAVQNELKYLGELHFSPYISDDAMEAAIQKYIVPAMQGQVTVDRAAAQLTSAVNLLLQQGKAQVG